MRTEREMIEQSEICSPKLCRKATTLLPTTVLTAINFPESWQAFMRRLIGTLT